MPCLTRIIFLGITLFLSVQVPLCPAETIDFSKTPHENTIWKLDGAWDFYWQEILFPDGEPQHESIPMAVGRAWNGQTNTRDRSQFGAFGYGTYERRLKGLAWQREGYEFGLASASSAYRAYIYPANDPGRFVTIGNGQVGSSQETTIPNIRPQFIHFFPSGPDEVWVVRVQVANFHDSKGGLWTVPTLSLKDSSSRMFHIEIGLSMAASGMALVIGFYNFMLYYRRREDKPSLLLALFCFVVGFRNLATSDIYGYLDPREKTWIYQMKWLVEYLSILLASWTLAAFYFFAFETRKKSRVFYASTVMTVGAVLSVLMLPTHVFTGFLSLYQGVCAVSTYYVISMMIKCLIQKRSGSRVLLLGGLIFLVSAFYDVGVSQGWLPLPYTNQFATVIFIFLYSQIIAAGFSKAFQTSERLQNSLREEVNLQTAEIRNVMEHIPQGIFIMDSRLRIKGQYARFLEDLFGQHDLSGLPALDLIFQNSQEGTDMRSVTQSCLFAGMGEELLLWELNQHLLPREITRVIDQDKLQTLELTWHPIADDRSRVCEVLVSVRDITELKELQKQSAEDRLHNDMILEILALKPGFFDSFWSYSESLVSRLSPCLDQTRNFSLTAMHETLHQIHAWKGLSRAANFRVLTDAIHELESRIQALRNAEDGDQSSLKELWSRIRALLETYQRQNTRIQQYSHASPSRDQKNILWSEILAEFHRDLESLARELNLPTPRLVPHVLDFKVAARTSIALKAALIQLGRNSLVHGIEPPAQRLAHGKTKEGVISIDYHALEDDGFELRYRDDGPGLCLQKIASKAYEKNLMRQGQPLSAEEAIQFIMSAEFSTADQVSMIAGRGVGMKAIAHSIEELGGTFHVSTDREAGKQLGHVPVSFVIALPASLIEPVPDLLQTSSM